MISEIKNTWSLKYSFYVCINFCESIQTKAVLLVALKEKVCHTILDIQYSPHCFVSL